MILRGTTHKIKLFLKHVTPYTKKYYLKKRVDVSLVNKRPTVALFFTIGHLRFFDLLHVTIRCKRNMNNLVLSLAPKFTKLQFLILRQDTPQLRDEAVEKIATHCHDLQELDLSKSFRLTDRSLHAIAHGCPNLVKLNISGCSAFSDAALVYLTGFCRKLKILNLCGCVKAASDTALKVL